MNRRTVLGGVAASPPLARPVAAGSATPVMAMFREWERLRAVQSAAFAVDPSGEGATPDCEAATRAVHDWEDRLWAEPARTPQDVIAKFAAVTAYGVFAMEDERTAPEFWAEARRMMGVPG